MISNPEQFYSSKSLPLIVFLFLFHFSQLFSQVPEGYYSGTEGLRSAQLKEKLYNIIKGHSEYPYTSSSTDVWDILKDSDRDPDNPANVILFYTGWSVNAAQEYNGGTGWNREHVWAKSHGDFGTDPGPGTDCHHLRPTDISVNAARDSRWFDYSDEAYFDGGLNTGCFLGSDKYTWQPRTEVMGDVARMIFYMACRYEGENGEPDLEVIDYLPADNFTSEPVHARLSALLEWNRMDPVDDFERNRNEVVYSYQHNRNPFIDHPEFVDLIYLPENSAPYFGLIQHSPETPTEGENVVVSAEVGDSDGSLSTVLLHWDTNPYDLSNEAAMNPEGKLYLAVIPGQPANSFIYYMISATDDLNETSYSGLLSFSVIGSTPTSPFFTGGVQVYPNPFHDRFMVRESEGRRKYILDSAGKIVFIGTGTECYPANLPAGSYYLLIETPEQEKPNIIKIQKK